MCFHVQMLIFYFENPSFLWKNLVRKSHFPASMKLQITAVIFFFFVGLCLYSVKHTIHVQVDINWSLTHPQEVTCCASIRPRIAHNLNIAFKTANGSTFWKKKKKCIFRWQRPIWRSSSLLPGKSEWNRYISKWLYGGGSSKCECQHDTATDSQTAEWWRRNNSAVK